jgi:hypothetical protein
LIGRLIERKWRRATRRWVNVVHASGLGIGARTERRREGSDAGRVRSSLTGRVRSEKFLSGAFLYLIGRQVLVSPVVLRVRLVTT